MPARPSRPDLRLPHGFARLRCFPQREVARIVFVVLVDIDPRSVAHAGKILLRQLAVLGKLGDAEVIRTIVGAIGVTLVHQPGDEVRHLLDVVGRIHQLLGMLDIQRVGILQKRLPILLGVFLHRNAVARRIANDLVIHVGDVHDVLQLIAALLQEPSQRVDHDERAEIADVAVVVNRRPASVHADQVVFQRMKLFDLRGQRIKKLKWHESSCDEYGILECRGAPEKGSTGNASLYWWICSNRGKSSAGHRPCV